MRRLGLHRKITKGETQHGLLRKETKTTTRHQELARKSCQQRHESGTERDFRLREEVRSRIGVQRENDPPRVPGV